MKSGCLIKGQPLFFWYLCKKGHPLPDSLFSFYRNDTLTLATINNRTQS